MRDHRWPQTQHIVLSPVGLKMVSVMVCPSVKHVLISSKYAQAAKTTASPSLCVCLQTLIPQGFPLNHSRSCCVTCYPIMTRENEASLRQEANMQWHLQV